MKKLLRELSMPEDTCLIVKEETGQEFTAPFHYHQGYEFTYIVKGQGKFYGGDSVMNFKAGDLYLFGPGFPHFFVNDRSLNRQSEHVHSIFVQFHEDFMGREFYQKSEFSQLKDLLNESSRGIKIRDPSNELQEFMMAFPALPALKAVINLLSMLENISSLPDHGINYISSSLYRISTEEKESKDKLERVCKYIMANFKDEVTTRDAAAIVSMNEAAFCRYFKRRTTKTLSQFVNTVRITHAIHLLTVSDIAVSGICFACGFNNLSYFNRQFRTITGNSPLSYRREFNLS
ncbi:hypothetical protein N180_00490 [Pedobacter antarcticus 4BY]|uniref:HTH araC/xylS-type domain-containing protein n=2 Tax=Pedobacter antarcticus TaxID=34086 RepID=A0A081PBS7_9SPHI|nr:AraC family transcriptional regulator [Pedobacter antarcticus]KEQ28150.1 hypothetical protein N180_00490 [Pedobacter antarcticus 4BY]SFE43608.1 AraC-type DNA-binding protein [Pedobacter antarcticus]